MNFVNVLEQIALWYESASVRDLITTAFAIVSGIYGILEFSFLKPRRRAQYDKDRRSERQKIDRERKRQSDQLSQLQGLLHDANSKSYWYYQQFLKSVERLEHERKNFEFEQQKRYIFDREESLKSERRMAELIHSLNNMVTPEIQGAGAATAPSVARAAARQVERETAKDEVTVSVSPKSAMPGHYTHRATGYENLNLVREVAEADDEVVDFAISRLKAQLLTYSEKALPAASGDKITLSGQGYIWTPQGWHSFDGGKLSQFPVVIGSNILIPGFEDQLIGSRVGDNKHIRLVFPSDYHAAEMAGRHAEFRIHIDSIEEPHDFDITESTVKAMGFKDVAHLRDVLREGATRDLQTASDQRLKRQLLDKLDEANKFVVPADLVEAEHEQLWNAQLAELKMRNLPIEALGKSAEAAKNELVPIAERRVRLGLVMSSLQAAAARDGLEYIVTENDMDDQVAKLIEQAGPDAAQMRANLAIPENREALRGPILEDKITKWLYRQANITTKVVPAHHLLKELS